MTTETQVLDPRAAVRSSIDLNSTFDVASVTMNTLATVVCCLWIVRKQPPVVIGAMIIAMLLAFGVLLLTFTDIVGIQVAGSIVMWMNGYRGIAQQSFVDELKRNLLSLTALCTLAVALAVQLREVISKEVYAASVCKILNTAAATHKGAYLTEVRFRRDSGRIFVVAAYRTPIPFTPEEVGALDPRLPLMPGTSSLYLRVRSIPVTVASKAGYLFSSEDLTEFVRLQ